MFWWRFILKHLKEAKLFSERILFPFGILAEFAFSHSEYASEFRLGKILL